MRTIISSLLVILFSLSALSQDGAPYLTFTAGLSTPGNHALIICTGGYQFDNGLFAEGSMRMVRSSQIGQAVYDKSLTPENPVHIGVVAGYDIKLSSFDIMPVVGGHYRLVSADLPYLNKFEMSAGLRIRKDWFLAEYCLVGPYKQATIGFYICINQETRCPGH
jgi:hypothetical protein